jgi:hypothetical protein
MTIEDSVSGEGSSKLERAELEREDLQRSRPLD